jgi:hypothetical protein
MTNGMHDDMPGAWASDPWRRFTLRWHDGIHWTSHVTDGTEVLVDPPGVRADRPLPSPPPHARPVAPPPAATAEHVGPAPAPEPAATAVQRERDNIGARPTERPRSARWTLIASCVVVPIIGLVLADARDRSDAMSLAPTTSATGPVGTEAPVAVTPSTLPLNTTTTSTTTTTEPAPETDPRLVQDCVVPFAAYIGDAELARLWTSLDMDEARLREHCEGLGLIELIELSRQRASSEAFMNGAGTSVPAAPAVPARTTPPTTVPRRSPSVPDTTAPSPAVASSAGVIDPTTTTSTTEPPSTTTTTATTTTTEAPSTTTTSTTTTTTVPEPPFVPATDPPVVPATDPPIDPPADPIAAG